MKHYAGLAVSVKETSVCVVDEAGKIVRESKVPSHPEDSVDVLKGTAWRLERIGLEAGPLSQLHFSAWRRRDRNFGLKVGAIWQIRSEDPFVEGMLELVGIIEPLLAARQKLREMITKLHRKLLLVVRDDHVGRRLMTIPGVGPVVSLAFKSMIDIPARFRNSKAVGPSLGLTPVLNQSGEGDRIGRVSLCEDEMMRALFYEAAQVIMTRVQKWSRLKAWAMNVAKRRGLKKAIVALARRLAVTCIACGSMAQRSAGRTNTSRRSPDGSRIDPQLGGVSEFEFCREAERCPSRDDG
jgi:transposase